MSADPDLSVKQEVSLRRCMVTVWQTTVLHGWDYFIANRKTLQKFFDSTARTKDEQQVSNCVATISNLIEAKDVAHDGCDQATDIDDQSERLAKCGRAITLANAWLTFAKLEDEVLIDSFKAFLPVVRRAIEVTVVVGASCSRGLLDRMAIRCKEDMHTLQQIGGGASGGRKWYHDATDEDDPVEHYKKTLKDTASQVSEAAAALQKSFSRFEQQVAASCKYFSGN